MGSTYLDNKKKQRVAINYFEEEYREYLERYPSDPFDARRRFSYYNFAQWHRHREDDEESSSGFSTALSENKRSPRIAILDSARTVDGEVRDPYGHGKFTAEVIRSVNPGAELSFYRVLNEKGQGSASLVNFSET